MRGTDTNGLVVYALTSKTSDASLPDVPSITNTAGMNEVFYLWFGLLAPSGVPKNIVDRMNGELNAVLQARQVAPPFVNFGVLACAPSTSTISTSVVP